MFCRSVGGLLLSILRAKRPPFCATVTRITSMLWVLVMWSQNVSVFQCSVLSGQVSSACTVQSNVSISVSC